MTKCSNQLVTVFGGSGFIGRYACEALLKQGVRVRIAARDPRSAHFLQPLAQVGQIGFVRADVMHRGSVRAALDGATSAVFLPGVMKGAVRGTHVDGASNVAQEAAAIGARSLVHLSAIGADPKAESDYACTKGEGEEQVRAAFPLATILRPSIVFGPEDMLTNRLAGLSWMPYLPVFAPSSRFAPVYVRDLAQAIALATVAPAEHAGRTYEIAGPEILTMRELNEEVMAAAGSRTQLVDLPDFASSAIARLGFLPGAPLTRDQWLMLQKDNVPGGGMPGLEAFGIEPTPLSAVAPEWLGRFQDGGRFSHRRVNLTATS